MRKLIDAYRAVPSPARRTKLAAYIAKHPIAVCLLAAEDVVFLTTHNFL